MVDVGVQLAPPLRPLVRLYGVVLLTADEQCVPVHPDTEVGLWRVGPGIIAPNASVREIPTLVVTGQDVVVVRRVGVDGGVELAQVDAALRDQG